MICPKRERHPTGFPASAAKSFRVEPRRGGVFGSTRGQQDVILIATFARYDKALSDWKAGKCSLKIAAL